MSEHKCLQCLNCKNSDINFGRLIRSTYFSGSNCRSSYRLRETYFYNINTDTWTRGPDMSRARAFHTCNLVTHNDGTRDIVVVGGLGDPSSCNLGNRDVDIIHLDSNSQAHRSGKNDSLHCKSLSITLLMFYHNITGAPAPIIVRGHSTAVYGDTIVMMGGYESSSCSSGKGYSKAIYE